MLAISALLRSHEILKAEVLFVLPFYYFRKADMLFISQQKVTLPAKRLTNKQKKHFYPPDAVVCYSERAPPFP